MISLIIDNSTCHISGLDMHQFEELREILSYRIAPEVSYYGGGYRSPKRYLLSKRGDFPTGLLYLVYQWANNTNANIQHTTHLATRPIPQFGMFSLNLDYEPYEEQWQAAMECFEKGRGIVCAPTGFGKSAIVSLIIQLNQVPTLVVVPNLELKKQLSESLKKAFGNLSNITVENIDALDPDTLDTKHHCVIIDEFHHSGAATYQKLNKKAWKNIYFKFGLTATPFRSQDNERLLLESVLSQVIYRVEYQHAVDKGYIVPLEAYYYELPKIDVEGSSWPQVYSELVVHREDRNDLIKRLLINLNASGKSTLALVKEIRHGENLSSEGAFLFANGQDEDTRGFIGLFNQGDKKVLIGTNGILGEGVDTKPAEYVVIAGLGKSKNAFMQQCGRGFRVYPGKESCKVILFYDPSHKWSKAHFKAQCKILKEEYGVEAVRL